MLTACHWYQRH